MRHTTRQLWIAIVLVSLAGCSDEDGPGQFVYPLRVGNEWHYTQSIYFDLDTAIIGQGVETIHVVVGAKEEWPGVGQVFRLDIRSGVDDFIDGTQFFQQTDLALRLMAYCGIPPDAYPKLGCVSGDNPNAALAFSSLDFAASGGCDVYPRVRYTDRPVSLQYPWRDGASWTFREPPTIPWKITKSVTGDSTISTAAGRFAAYRVVWAYDSAPHAHIYDDIAAVGLIRREIRADSVEYTTHQYPGGQPLYGALISILTLDSLRIR